MKKGTQEKIEAKANYFFDYLEDYIRMFLAAVFIVYGILDLQSMHYPEENYQPIGWLLIGVGVGLGIWAQWSFVRKRKNLKKKGG
ncbi:MAG TPA: hypothetical protein EYG70_06250 [Sulfurimonas sp.]|nr:hypothetical protein [Sulfurimonas sp.]